MCAAIVISISTVRSHLLAAKSPDVSIRVAARSKLILISSPARLQLRLSHCRSICATTLPAHAIPLISALLMRWPSSRDGTREIPADITMRRDVSRISLFSALRRVLRAGRRTRLQGARERKKALCTAARQDHAVKKFPLGAFSTILRGDGGGWRWVSTPSGNPT